MDDSHIFRLSQPLPVGQLPREVSAHVFQVDEQTHAVGVHQLKDTQLPTSQTYDALRAEVFDAASELGFGPPQTALLLFDFAEPVRNGFRQLTDFCRGRLASSLPSSSPTVQSLGTSIQASTGVSFLQTPSIRDVLLFLAVNARQIPSRRTPQLAETLVSLASMGPPSHEGATHALRSFIHDPQYGEEFQFPQAEVALIRNHWRPATTRCTFGSLFHWTEADFANGDEGRKLEQGTASLLRTLVDTGFVRMPLAGTADENKSEAIQEKKEVAKPETTPAGVRGLRGKFEALARKGFGQVPIPKYVSAAEKKRQAEAAAAAEAEWRVQDNTRQLLERAAKEGSVRVLKQIVGPDGIFPAAQLPEQARARLLLGTVEVATHGTQDSNPERDSKLAYLLDDVKNGGVGIDPSVAAKSTVGSDRSAGFTQTALHIAMHIGDTQAVDLLLQYGARSDIRDERGRLPSERSLPKKKI